MELKNGNTVVVDGKTAKLETSWGAGKHKMFKLDDGRVLPDLDKAIKEGKATLVTFHIESKPVERKTMQMWGRDAETK